MVLLDSIMASSLKMSFIALRLWSIKGKCRKLKELTKILKD